MDGEVVMEEGPLAQYTERVPIDPERTFELYPDAVVIHYGHYWRRRKRVPLHSLDPKWYWFPVSFDYFNTGCFMISCGIIGCLLAFQMLDLSLDHWLSGISICFMIAGSVFCVAGRKRVRYVEIGDTSKLVIGCTNEDQEALRQFAFAVLRQVRALRRVQKEKENL